MIPCQGSARAVYAPRVFSPTPLFASITLFLHHNDDDDVVNLQFVHQSTAALQWLLCRHHRNVGSSLFSVDFSTHLKKTTRDSTASNTCYLNSQCFDKPTWFHTPRASVVTYRSHATWLIGNTWYIVRWQAVFYHLREVQVVLRHDFPQPPAATDGWQRDIPPASDSSTLRK